MSQPPVDDTLRARLDAAMTEADFMAQVVEYAHLKDWRVCHFRPSRTASGWRTAVAYDAEGWPDLCLVRERIVIAELKSEHGKLSSLQSDWIGALEAAKAEVYVWRPSSWPEVERVLS
jgi:hypothetical protein